ncbi:hypothetical protein [Streptacidiphilus neutrinimicus]|uniref:hypothetical protein n=1 Tax=Streptacidiphilus neutrinimicus TaxID=105420 RepID=UPI0005AB3067|nr:hypothetical protein [Streptacidiphilus neutrinimicus]
MTDKATDAGARQRPAVRHQRPEGVNDTQVSALGKVSEALETTIRARGHLYSFHQLTGHADLLLDQAVSELREAGHQDLADLLEEEIIGRNVLDGRWTFQIVEEYDQTYYEPFVQAERTIREEIAPGRTHVYEAEMKEGRRTAGHPQHTARPL